jgi:lipopolysaccharide export LptBFGC system permease protein LptF
MSQPGRRRPDPRRPRGQGKPDNVGRPEPLPLNVGRSPKRRHANVRTIVERPTAKGNAPVRPSPGPLRWRASMGRTLFWYIFKDLLRIFMMTSGALAGIMSFGGLLRPLTQNGLDGPQVALLLANFMPAMSTYSLPVAALFATTMVYGRMSADNEITACRACGVSFLTLTGPALLLGVVVSAMSLYLLCFTVPRATLKVEQVIYSNLAKLIAHEIQQTHRTTFDTSTVFARDAYLPPRSPADPKNEQAVVLVGPLIVSYVAPPGKPKWYQLAKDFWSASEAVAKIVEDPEDGSATLTVTLTHGVVFPRSVGPEKVAQAGAEAGAFGPIPIPSRVAEKTKFMDVFTLRRLQRDPSKGQQVQQALQQFIRTDQASAEADRIAAELRGPRHAATLLSGDDTLVLTVPPTATITSMAAFPGSYLLASPAGDEPVRYREQSGGQDRLTAEGHACRLSVTVANGQDAVATVSVEMRNALIDAADDGPADAVDTAAPAPLARHIAVPLPPDVAGMADRTAEQYLAGRVGSAAGQRKLQFAWVDLINHIKSELHARAAFVVSCLLLVVVGSSLGMMFRSGNFLTAFAVSVVPAMLSTVLIVTGQHTAEGTPTLVTAANNPLHLGLAVIWTGNVVIGIAAVVLLVRLQRR